MKNLILIVFFISSVIFSQESHLLGDSHYELFIGTKNCSGETNVFSANIVNSISSGWDKDHQLTQDHLVTLENLTLSGNTNSSDSDTWRNGFDFLRYSGQTFSGDEYGGILYYSKYKITNETSNKYFFIDYMDCRYHHSYNSGFPWLIDVWVLWDGATNNFKYKTNANANFTSIQHASTLHIEDAFSLSGNDKSCFELYTIISNSNDHPYLEWNPYHNPSLVSSYKIYKKKSSPNYELLASTTGLDYLDTSEYIYDGGGNKIYASYYVKAELTSGGLSPESNTVSSAVEDVGQVEKLAVANNNNYEISLNNYPNPFNPTTTISYSIPKSSLVHITVYDLLGRKITELINEIKEAGPSGLYI